MTETMTLAMNSWIPGYCICVPFSNYFYFLQLIILLLLFFGDFVKVSGVRCWPCKSAGCIIRPRPGNCPRGKLLPDNCSLMIGPLITAVWAIFPLGKSSYKKSHPNDNNNNNNINNNDNNKSLRPGNTGLMSSGG